MLAAHIGAQFAENTRLSISQHEAELLKKRFDQTIVAAARQSLGIGLKIAPPLLHLQLKRQELVESQSLATAFGIVQFLWGMNGFNSLFSVERFWKRACALS